MEIRGKKWTKQPRKQHKQPPYSWAFLCLVETWQLWFIFWQLIKNIRVVDVRIKLPGFYFHFKQHNHIAGFPDLYYRHSHSDVVFIWDCAGAQLLELKGYLALMRYWARLMLAGVPVMVIWRSDEPSMALAILICAPDICRISFILVPWRPIMQPISWEKTKSLNMKHGILCNVFIHLCSNLAIHVTLKIKFKGLWNGLGLVLIPSFRKLRLFNDSMVNRSAHWGCPPVHTSRAEVFIIAGNVVNHFLIG